jgi:hypothetical protein
VSTASSSNERAKASEQKAARAGSRPAIAVLTTRERWSFRSMIALVYDICVYRRQQGGNKMFIRRKQFIAKAEKTRDVFSIEILAK